VCLLVCAPRVQGISFFLPNMTWLQPPGFVHKMISQTWAETTLASVLSNDTSGGAVSAAAQRTADGSTLVLRAVNTGNVAQSLAATVSGVSFVGNNGTSWTLSGSQYGDNTPSSPTGISPVQAPVATSSATTVTLALPAYSFVVATFNVQ